MLGLQQLPSTAVPRWQLLSEGVTPSIEAVEKRTLNGQRWKEKRYHFCVPPALHLHLQFSQSKSALREDTPAPFPSCLPAAGHPRSPLCKANSRLQQVSCCARNTRPLPLIHRGGEISSTSGWNLSPAVPGAYTGSEVVCKKSLIVLSFFHYLQMHVS